jgi:hypothetical protein
MATLPPGGEVPGAARDGHGRLPWPVALLLAPLAGGVWLLTAPVVGLAMAAWGLARGAARAVARSLAAASIAAPAPGEAHLTGTPGEGGREPAARTGPEAGTDEVEREIAERRRKDHPAGGG